MRIEHTSIPEVVIVHPEIFRDARGYFFESFNEKAFAELMFPVHFVQDNESRSCRGVIRGLHYQKGDAAQGKLVRVIRGRVLDIAVDIRRGSPSFGKWAAAELSGENAAQLFIPRGFAHGFSVLSDEAVFQYKCDRFYDPSAEGAVAWDDPDLGIDWKIPSGEEILSDKDRRHLRLKDIAPEDLFEYGKNQYE